MSHRVHISETPRNAFLSVLRHHPLSVPQGALRLTSMNPTVQWVWRIDAVLGSSPVTIQLPEVPLDPPWHQGLDQLWEDAPEDIRAAFFMDQAHELILSLEQCALPVHIDTVTRITQPEDVKPASFYGVWTLSNGATLPVAFHIDESVLPSVTSFLVRLPKKEPYLPKALCVPARLLYGVIHTEHEELASWQRGDIVFFDERPSSQSLMLCLQSQDAVFAIHAKKSSGDTLHLEQSSLLPQDDDSLALYCQSSPFLLPVDVLYQPPPVALRVPILSEHLHINHGETLVAYGHGALIGKKRGVRLSATPRQLTRLDNVQRGLQDEAG